MEQVNEPVAADEARVNVTWQGQNGDLPSTVGLDATDGDVKAMIAEAIAAGTIPGIRADANPDLRDFVIDRFAPTDARPYNLIQIRPKTPFGGLRDLDGAFVGLVGCVCKVAKELHFDWETFISIADNAWNE